MGNTQNFIEINGKRYDSVTGVMIGSSITQNSSRMQPVVDGFTRRSKNTSTPRSTALQIPLQHSVKPQKANTLMREAVKKPIHNLSLNQQPRLNSAKTIFGRAIIAPRVGTTTPHRLQNAKSVQKSNIGIGWKISTRVHLAFNRRA